LALATTLVAAALTAPATADEGSPVEAGITVPKVEGMGSDWINGVDVSSVLSLEESGVTFYDFEGNEADLFDVLADAGVNWVRVRVWNEPYSSTDPAQGYGGGDVDAERATEIARRATEAGMQVLVDFHYSDFWAHPGQQYSPRAWREMGLQERSRALYGYTADTLTTMRAAGADVGMVQIGNETNGPAIAGVTGWTDSAELFEAGSQAVQDTLGNEVPVAVHFTDPEQDGHYAAAAKALADHGVDYDVFLSSYYPYWHDSMENLADVLDEVATTYDKDVAVVETSWAHTLADGDGYPNVIDTAQDKYPVSVQGQALAIRDVMQAVANVSGDHGLGVFYWEPAWLPVGPPAETEQNWDLWQEYGSGWASTYSQEFYDPEGTLDEWADDYGGSSWDNQALFAFDGTPLESLRVFDYARTGAIGPHEVDSVESPQITVAAGEQIVLPDTVQVSFTDATTEQHKVTWSEPVAWVRGAGRYTFHGTTTAGQSTTATVTVLADETKGQHIVLNHGFADGAAHWTGTGSGYTISSDSDPYEGSRSTHFWADEDYRFAIEQEITDVPPGEYVLSAKAQGGDAGATDTLGISAASGISTVSADFELDGYQNWQSPQTEPITVGAAGVVTIRAELSLSAEAWGTLDSFSLAAVAEEVEADTTELDELVEHAQGVDKSRYTESSAGALAEAVDRAQFVLDAPQPGQASVDAATEELQAALEGLVSVPENGAGETDGGESSGGAAGAGTDPTKKPAGSDDTSPGGDGTGGSDPVGDADSSGRNDQWTGDATAGDGVHELSRTGANPPLALALVLLTAGAVVLVLRRRAQRARRTH